MDDESAYDAGLYERQREMSASSARAILPLVLAGARSVVDVGCGIGTWSKVAADLGANVVGLDGAWVTEPLIDQFQAVDLSQTFRLDRRFDLAICMEVAEHLAPSRAESFVADLCALSHRVLFSAAIPGQGGHRHVNERWPDYWQAQFRTHGYEPQDVIRASVWDDTAVEPFYAQNAFLYVRGGPRIEGMPIRVVHPDLFASRVSGSPHAAPAPTLRHFPAALRRAIRHRLG